MKRIRYNRNGFTLTECVLSLMVVGIVLVAAAALSFAMHSADRVTDDMGESQAYVRYATMRISELIGKSNMVFSTSYLRGGICVWTDNDGDKQIDPLELVYVEYDAANNEIDMVSFSKLTAEVVGGFTVAQARGSYARQFLENYATARYTDIVFDCTAASFPVSNPVGELVNILFIVEEDGISKVYQVTSRRIVSMDYLLDASGELKSGDDD